MASFSEMAIVPDTQARLIQNTDPESLRKIRRRTKLELDAASRDEVALERRLADIEREWDIERTLMTHAGTVVLAGSLFGLLGNRRYLMLTGAVGAFLIQHAMQGWCPPMPILRRLGIRTAREIEKERNALKAMRGDYIGVATGPGAVQDALRAADLG